MKKKWILIVGLFVSVAGFSQKKILTEKDYAVKPCWIDMMDIEGVNYHETLKAYDIYWQNHNFPEEEGDRYTGKGEKIKKKASKKELRERREEAAMQFQVKKFKHWIIKNEPFVKENGQIMTAQERLKFHNDHL